MYLPLLRYLLPDATKTTILVQIKVERTAAAPVKKDFKPLIMKGRDLLVLVRTNNDQRSLEEAVESLHKILLQVECDTVFCCAHELVKRNKITNKHKRILDAARAEVLKPFYFLINKN